MTKVALVGVGRWGKNLLRVLNERCIVSVCCNKSDPTVHTWLKEHYPHIKSTFDYNEVLEDWDIDRVVIATPIATHAELACRALEAGKHVFVEKPLATNVRDAEAVVAVASGHRRVLFVGHVFRYHPVLKKIKEITEQDPISYARMSWTKFGTFEEDVFWNLVSHEVSIALELFNERPRETSTLCVNGIMTTCDLVTARLDFGGNRECLIDVNRCAPTRNKAITVLTSSGQALVWENSTLYKLDKEARIQPLYEAKEEPLDLELSLFLETVPDEVSMLRNVSADLTVVEVVEQLRQTCVN